VAPDSEISRRINQDKIHLEDPEKNVFKVPFFLENRIISNEMCRILIMLLHYDPEHRYQSLAAVKEDLLKLRKSIFETPLLLRQILKHPVLPQENLDFT
jgi:serine/threonine protein kinase